jgi:hypothetical protein
MSDPFDFAVDSSQRSPPLSPSPSKHFPCLADELEEQVKALEDDFTLATPSATAPSAASTQPQPLRLPSTPGRPSAATTTQHALSSMVATQHNCHSQPFGSRTSAGADRPRGHLAPPPAAAASPGLGPLSLQHIASSAVGASIPLPPLGQRGAPLAAALHNADCVRGGQAGPWAGAWRGCCAAPWCNKERGHVGTCNTRATVPGLAAYLPEELAAMGVPALPELRCELPPLAAQAAASAAATAALAAPTPTLGSLASYGGTSTLYDLHQRGDDANVDAMISNYTTSSIKRRGVVEIGPCSDCSGSLTASDNNSNNGEDDVEQQLLPGAARTSKRHKKAAAAAAAKTAGGDAEEDYLPCDDGAATSDEHRSTLTDEIKLGHAVAAGIVLPVATISVHKSRARAGRGSGSRRGNASAARRGPAPVGSPKHAAAGVPASKSANPRAGPQRRGPQVWVSGQTLDPRTGQVVTEVQPGTFCSQCRATSTPVWRAGPFGHKTLCNACGVRWMKIKPGRK